MAYFIKPTDNFRVFLIVAIRLFIGHQSILETIKFHIEKILTCSPISPIKNNNSKYK